MRCNTLPEWLQWLESCHPSDIELGLERVAAVATNMSLTAMTSKVITVAGTNGKGSCVASLNALLLSAGYRVGCYTSPHFIDYNERVVINAKPVTDALLMASFERIDRARGEIALTYFEFGTLAALDIFNHSELDVIVLEVGLGGRLDAVNIVDADVSVVTSIDLDHSDWLGFDREKIGMEKAGIYRSQRPAISAGLQPPASLRQVAASKRAPFFQAGEHYNFGLSAEGSAHWFWRGQNYQGQPLQLELAPPALPQESVAAAIQALQLLGLPLDNVDYGCVAKVALPGRFQQLEFNRRQLILDVAHNPAAATFLAAQLTSKPCKGRTFALLAVMADKDVGGIVKPLIGCFDSWFVGQLPTNQRAMPPTELAALLQQQGAGEVRECATMSQAFEQALLLLEPEDRLVVFGSFFTVAAVLAIIAEQQ